MVWIFGLEIADLSFEICFLMVAGDSNITDFLFLFFEGAFMSLGEESFNISDFIEMKSSWGSNCFDFSISIPSPKTAGRNSKVFLDFGSTNVLIRSTHT